MSDGQGLNDEPNGSESENSDEETTREISRHWRNVSAVVPLEVDLT